MRLERLHAECIGQGEGIVVVSDCQLDLRRIGPHRNVAEEAQSICLMPAFLVCTGEC
jgi:hypothetical protein